MNKQIYLFITLISIVLFMIRCEKEEKENDLGPIEISSSIHNVSEYGGSDGAIDLTLIGGNLPYSFIWSNNSFSEDISNLISGVYSVSVSDSKSQIKIDSFEVTQPNPIPIGIQVEIINPSETGASDGSINTTISGGYLPYTISWSNGETTENISNLTSGEYIITINDNAGQTLIDTIIVEDALFDIDGNTYSFVKIGDQTWMGENLRVKHAPDGSSIESYAYNNDTTNEQKYGRLYTWNAAMNGTTQEEAQGICPDGWHIPSDDEFKQLEMYLGMTQSEADRTNAWRGSPVGTLLKAGGDTGYNAQMGGRMVYNGSFGYLGQWEYMWTSTEYSSNASWRRCLANIYSSVGRYNSFTKSYGFSVRCVKNED